MTSWRERIACAFCEHIQEAVVSSHKRFHRCEKCAEVNDARNWRYASTPILKPQKVRRQAIRK